MKGKKFALVFAMLILLIMVGAAGMFFAMLRLHLESESATLLRFERALNFRYTADRDTWDISRSQFSAKGAEAAGSQNLHHIGRYTPVFYGRGDRRPMDTLPLHIVQVLEQWDNWMLVRTVRGDKWIDLDWIPSQTLIDEVPGFNQQALGLPTGCEIVALAMLINKYREIDVFTLVDEMPRSYDPLYGFRGDPFTRGGFTILPPALLEMTERHIGSAVDMTGASISDVQAQLALGRPVLAWLRGMFGFNVHVITLTGFNEYGFFYNDPWLGGVNEFITYEYFMSMWDDPIRDNILNRIYPARIAMSY